MEKQHNYFMPDFTHREQSKTESEPSLITHTPDESVNKSETSSVIGSLISKVKRKDSKKKKQQDVSPDIPPVDSNEDGDKKSKKKKDKDGKDKEPKKGILNTIFGKKDKPKENEPKEIEPSEIPTKITTVTEVLKEEVKLVETPTDVSEDIPEVTQAPMEQNLTIDGPFWVEKPIYHDAEKDYQIYLANLRKSRPTPIEINGSLGQPPDKDDDSDSSNGPGSPRRQNQNGTTNGPSSFGTILTSSDLPGGMCSWKDESTYLSSEVITELSTKTNKDSQVYLDTSEEIPTKTIETLKFNTDSLASLSEAASIEVFLSTERIPSEPKTNTESIEAFLNAEKITPSESMVDKLTVVRIIGEDIVEETPTLVCSNSGVSAMEFLGKDPLSDEKKVVETFSVATKETVSTEPTELRTEVDKEASPSEVKPLVIEPIGGISVSKKDLPSEVPETNATVEDLEAKELVDKPIEEISVSKKDLPSKVPETKATEEDIEAKELVDKYAYLSTSPGRKSPIEATLKIDNIPVDPAAYLDSLADNLTRNFGSPDEKSLPYLSESDPHLVGHRSTEHSIQSSTEKHITRNKKVKSSCSLM